ncbi:GNAT family N-acetyltransferase [Bacillus wiedmannii]|uniref:GNAT family N-acetyltransferase n=1 Tax=Bacillus wiedmannii TaxID=1890302 RepID=UPI001C3F1E0F|nr:GNAT family N-acetyltransferase [Bacillus wiedmannii]
MILETEYLRLKEMRQDDFDDLKMMLQDPDVMYAYEHNFSDANVQSWLDRNIKRYKDFGFGLWGIDISKRN